MKLQTSNLAHRWKAVSTNEKNAKLGQWGHVGSRDLLFEILGPPNISGSNEASNFKFGT